MFRPQMRANYIVGTVLKNKSRSFHPKIKDDLFRIPVNKE